MPSAEATTHDAAIRTETGSRRARPEGEDHRVGAGLRPLRVSEGHRVVADGGLVSEPDLARRDSKLELCFVNGRLAREKSALHAVRQAYREYLMGGRFPIYVLMVSIAPDQVDVNVHPTKREVLFLHQELLVDTVASAVREKLLGGNQSRTFYFSNKSILTIILLYY